MMLSQAYLKTKILKYITHKFSTINGCYHAQPTIYATSRVEAIVTLYTSKTFF